MEYVNHLNLNGVSLHFKYTFCYSKDIVYFAHSYPYTVTQLKGYLDSLEADQNVNEFVLRRTLCKTLAGNTCYYLTITSVRCFKKLAKPQSSKKKGKRINDLRVIKVKRKVFALLHQFTQEKP
jgi:hypothetical protein